MEKGNSWGRRAREKVEKGVKRIALIGMLGISHEAPETQSLAQESDHKEETAKEIKRIKDSIKTDIGPHETDTATRRDTKEQQEFIKGIKDQLQAIDIRALLKIRSGSYDKEEFSNIYSRMGSLHEWHKALERYDLSEEEQNEVINRLSEQRVKFYEDVMDALEIQKTSDGLLVKDENLGFAHEIWIGEDNEGHFELVSLSGDYSQSINEDLFYKHGLDENLDGYVVADIRDSLQVFLKEKMLAEELGEDGEMEHIIEEVLQAEEADKKD